MPAGCVGREFHHIGRFVFWCNVCVVEGILIEVVDVCVGVVIFCTAQNIQFEVIQLAGGVDLDAVARASLEVDGEGDPYRSKN